MGWSHEVKKKKDGGKKKHTPAQVISLFTCAFNLNFNILFDFNFFSLNVWKEAYHFYMQFHVSVHIFNHPQLKIQVGSIIYEGGVKVRAGQDLLVRVMSL